MTYWVRWTHEIVFSSQGQAPVYEDMSLAPFANEYLAIVAEEVAPIKSTC